MSTENEKKPNIILISDRKPKANKLAVEILEKFLAMAKDGDLKSVALAAICQDDSAITAFSPSPHNLAQLGAVDIVATRLRRYLDKEYG